MKKIAILYPGDMGGNIAKNLIEADFEVFSDIAKRSEETRKQALEIGVQEMALQEIGTIVDCVISLVPPQAVMEVAQSYIDAVAGREDVALFIDMNAKSTETAEELASLFREADIPFVNACIIGRAAFIKEEGAIYYSGDKIPAFESSIGKIFEVQYLGEQIAAATAFKMCFAGFNKTITATFFETAIAANHFGITDKLFEEIERKMGGTVQDIEKIIGNYPKHIARRKQEMVELGEMLKGEQLPAFMATGAASAFEEVEGFDRFAQLSKKGEASMLTILESLQKDEEKEL